MIRGNYSLAAEFKKNELKQQHKIQQRQKRQHQLTKLNSIDPIRLYRQIELLEANPQKDQKDHKKLKQLKSDWDFIVKNKLHTSKIEPFLKKIESDKDSKRKAEKKLWGAKSVYFNPELNPLGKVPNAENLTYKVLTPLKNDTKPLKAHSSKKYERDPLIDTLGVVLPPGEPPMFYKEVFNTKKAIGSQKRPVEDDQEQNSKKLRHDDFHNQLSDSEDIDDDNEEYSANNALAPEEEAYWNAK